MSGSIQNNSINARLSNNIFKIQKRLAQSLERLSSGKRVNSGADDPGAMGIISNFSSTLRSYNAARGNIASGISITQTAEGALSEVSDILTRMRELSVQAADDSLQDTDRAALQTEYSALRAEIDSISSATEFNSKNLLNGNLSSSGLDIQIGINNKTADRMTITISSIASSDIGSSGSSTLSSTLISGKTNAQNAIDVIDAAITDVASERSKLGAYQNRLSYAHNAISSAHENINTAKNRIESVDLASESAKYTSDQIRLKAAVSLMAQARSFPSIYLRLLN